MTADDLRCPSRITPTIRCQTLLDGELTPHTDQHRFRTLRWDDSGAMPDAA